MTIKLTEEELHAAANLHHNEHFNILMDAIAKHANGLNERMVNAPTGDEWIRGQVKAYSALLDAINSAQKRLNELQQPKT